MGSSYESIIAQYGKYGKKLERAWQLVNTQSIKLHRFSPSGRELWTAVGKEGDQLVYEEQPYCSCRDFHYRVLGEKEETCYHLIGLKMAKQLKAFDIIEFDDEEYPQILAAILKDLSREE